MSELEEPQPTTEELLSILIVQQQRLYDLQLLILGHLSEEGYNNILATHKRMENWGPAPFNITNE